MKRTRRAALAMIAGSSGLLAVDTFGFTSTTLERDVSVDVVSDENAYLGLVDADGDGIETNGVLFEETGDSDRYPPISFKVVNQLTESISVTAALRDDRLRFEPTENASLEGKRALAADELGAGKAIDVAIEQEFTGSDGRPLGNESITTPLVIEADGETTRIEADRTLTLATDVRAVVNLCSVKDAPNVLIIVRKRENANGDMDDPVLSAERVDCADGESTVLDERTLSVPSLAVEFPGMTDSDLESAIATAEDVYAEISTEADDSSDPVVEITLDTTADAEEGDSQTTDPITAFDSARSGE